MKVVPAVNTKTEDPNKDFKSYRNYVRFTLRQWFNIICSLLDEGDSFTFKIKDGAKALFIM